MKIERKANVKVDFKNSVISIEDGKIRIEEYDKDGAIIDSNDLLEVLKEAELIDVDNVKISFSKVDDME